MKQGNVKWFDCKKGYGFITPDGEIKDVFVHITQLEKIGIRKLFDGQRVSFDIYDDRGRIAAGNLKLLWSEVSQRYNCPWLSGPGQFVFVTKEREIKKLAWLIVII